MLTVFLVFFAFFCLGIAWGACSRANRLEEELNCAKRQLQGEQWVEGTRMVISPVEWDEK